MTRRRFTVATTASLLAASSGIARAAPRGGRARFTAALRRHVEGGDPPGAVTLIANPASLHAEALGVMDLETRAPMRRDTLFRIASMTKPICAATVMRLVEDGKLRLDDPVDRWLPELANRRVLRRRDAALDDTVPAKRAITVRDLLTFRLGLGAIMAPPGSTPIQRAMDEAGVSPGPTPIQLLPDEYMKRLGALPLVHQPGEAWLYHIGAEVAGILVARVLGRPFGEVAAEQILAPLEMKDTGFVVPPEKLARLSTAYRLEDGKLVAWDRPADSFFAKPRRFASGGGQMGLVSTVDDYLAFARMLASGGGKVLTPATVAEMTRDQLGAAEKAASDFVPGFWKDNGWGLGMAVNKAGRFGWSGGFGTTFFVDPREQRVGILLTQRMMTSPKPEPIAADFERLAPTAL